MIFSITVEDVERSDAVRAQLAAEGARLAEGCPGHCWQAAARSDAYTAWIATWAEPGEVFFPALRQGLLFSADVAEPLRFHLGGDVVPIASLTRLARQMGSAVQVSDRTGLKQRILPEAGRGLRVITGGRSTGTRGDDAPLSLAIPGA
jgi:hypothetical protein